MGERGEQMQRDVLAVLRQSGEPMSAYGVMDKLKKSNPKIAPPTIYRAMNALIDTGHVHRLESLNAFMACRDEGHTDPSVLAICDDCGTVEERAAPGLVEQLSGVIGESGFEPQRHVIEVHGVCGSCGEDGKFE